LWEKPDKRGTEAYHEAGAESHQAPPHIGATEPSYGGLESAEPSRTRAGSQRYFVVKDQGIGDLGEVHANEGKAGEAHTKSNQQLV